jgi:hypothetical protein
MTQALYAHMNNKKNLKKEMKESKLSKYYLSDNRCKSQYNTKYTENKIKFSSTKAKIITQD